MTAIAGPLVLVGGGKMGSALLAGWLRSGLSPQDAWVDEPDPERRRALGEAHGVHVTAHPGGIGGMSTPRTLVVAVKPQLLDAAIPAYRACMDPRTLVLSIAAGKTIATFEAVFGAGTPVVRAMPNTPATRAEADALMAAVGETAWVEDEDLMHAVTAMSGGGPAYVFLLIEALAAAGAGLGLPADLAMRLSRATVIGSGELARQNPSPASQLRVDVTSPGGTTQAALAVLMGERGLQPLVDAALAAAAARSRELG